MGLSSGLLDNSDNWKEAPARAPSPAIERLGWSRAQSQARLRPYRAWASNPPGSGVFTATGTEAAAMAGRPGVPPAFKTSRTNSRPSITENPSRIRTSSSRGTTGRQNLREETGKTLPFRQKAGKDRPVRRFIPAARARAAPFPCQFTDDSSCFCRGKRAPTVGSRHEWGQFAADRFRQPQRKRPFPGDYLRIIRTFTPFPLQSGIG